MTDPFRIAVVGAGHLGRYHVQNLSAMDGMHVTAVDSDPTRKSVAEEYNVEFLSDYREVGPVDAVTIAVPTAYHFEVGSHFLSQGIPCLIEKPLATTVEQARDLTEIADENNTILQVGHVERFNPALRAVEGMINKPKFIEATRISPFPFRSADVGVVMDLMIHDIDIILHLVDQPLKEVRASATPILSRSEDVANARLEFEDGCVVNVTASRVAIKTERRMRIFQGDAYMSLDLHKREANVFRKREKLLSGEIDPTNLTPSQLDGMDPMMYALKHLIAIENPKVRKDANPLFDELQHFCDCVRNNEKPLVSGRHGTQAVEVAERILQATQL